MKIKESMACVIWLDDDASKMPVSHQDSTFGPLIVLGFGQIFMSAVRAEALVAQLLEALGEHEELKHKEMTDEQAQEYCDREFAT